MASVVSKAGHVRPTGTTQRNAATGVFNAPVWQVRSPSDVEHIMPEVQQAVREAQQALGRVRFTLLVGDGQGRQQGLETTTFEIAAERALLGILLYDNAAFTQVADIDVSLFREDLNARLFLEIKGSVARGKLAEPIQLSQQFEGDPAYEAVGGLRYLADLVDRAPAVRDAAALVHLLRELTANAAPPQPDAPGRPLDALDIALADAQARGASRAAEILSGPDMLGADDFADLVGMTREAVRQKLKKHEVLGLQGAKRGVRYPAWQVTRDGGLLPALPKLFAALGDSPWTIYRFLTQPNPALKGKPPLDSLRVGQVEPVITAAQSHARGDYG